MFKNKVFCFEINSKTQPNFFMSFHEVGFGTFLWNCKKYTFIILYFFFIIPTFHHFEPISIFCTANMNTIFKKRHIYDVNIKGVQIHRWDIMNTKNYGTESKWEGNGVGKSIAQSIWFTWTECYGNLIGKSRIIKKARELDLF